MREIIVSTAWILAETAFSPSVRKPDDQVPKPAKKPSRRGPIDMGRESKIRTGASCHVSRKNITGAGRGCDRIGKVSGGGALKTIESRFTDIERGVGNCFDRISEGRLPGMGDFWQSGGIVPRLSPHRKSTPSENRSHPASRFEQSNLLAIC